MNQRFSHRKSLGQHFLEQRSILETIIAFCQVTPGQTVLEIGPGQGTLTEVLLAAGHPVVAIEKDDRLIPDLQARFSGVEAFHLVHGDATTLSVDTLPLPARFSVVSNFPYQVGTHVIRRLLTLRDRIEKVGGILQAEVVNRLSATPGNKIYGFLTVFCAYYGRAVHGPMIRPGSFSPPPKVCSRMFRLTLNSRALLPSELEPLFFQWVSAAFAQRRKTLANNLAILGLPNDRIRLAMEEVGLPSNIRAEALSLAQFLALTERLAAHGN